MDSLFPKRNKSSSNPILWGSNEFHKGISTNSIFGYDRMSYDHHIHPNTTQRYKIFRTNQIRSQPINKNKETRLQECRISSIDRLIVYVF